MKEANPYRTTNDAERRDQTYVDCHSSTCHQSFHASICPFIPAKCRKQEEEMASQKVMYQT
ncbi:hypothetical protein QQP08_007542 [Theobroma cacao]|nr:hypothetical protein QQP08_007542 [Theobroma cacao]